jgi:sugar porter (SP) family MFS transporter
LLAYLSNYLISLADLGLLEWRWQLGVAAIPALLFFLLLFGIPRSARWLAARAHFDEARKVLRMMGSPDSEAELDVIQRSLHVELNSKEVPLFERKEGRLLYRKPILLALAIGAFNQLSGINVILYYLNDIFAFAGFGHVSSNLQAVIVGLTNLLATLAGMMLIDRLGRRALLLIGALGTAVCLISVATIFARSAHQALLVWALMAYIAFFAISQGAVIWVYIAEIFPTQVRSKGQSLGSGMHWVMNAVTSYAFPLIALHSHAAPFGFFAGMMVVQFIVVLVFFPETKQISLEDLQRRLGIT